MTFGAYLRGIETLFLEWFQVGQELRLEPTYEGLKLGVTPEEFHVPRVFGAYLRGIETL